MNLGKFYLSLSVANIQDSKVFYEQLGFKVIDGKIEEKWLVMQNETTHIGLFQDMFPKNTLTFMPSDARSLQELLKQRGVSISVEAKDGDGPAHFMIEDPDGNPILFDQH